MLHTHTPHPHPRPQSITWAFPTDVHAGLMPALPANIQSNQSQPYALLHLSSVETHPPGKLLRGYQA